MQETPEGTCKEPVVQSVAINTSTLDRSAFAEVCWLLALYSLQRVRFPEWCCFGENEPHWQCRMAIPGICALHGGVPYQMVLRGLSLAQFFLHVFFWRETFEVLWWVEELRTL